MYEELDLLMNQQIPQMELYCGIGKAVCRRTEKGAAVMASEYLSKHYPNEKGFSPRNLRRMRDFYRTYEKRPALLTRAMQHGWIQNVVIMEAELTMELQEWYIKASIEFKWTKTELITSIRDNVHEIIIVSIDTSKKCCCYIRLRNKKRSRGFLDALCRFNYINVSYAIRDKTKDRRRCHLCY